MFALGIPKEIYYSQDHPEIRNLKMKRTIQEDLSGISWMRAKTTSLNLVVMLLYTLNPWYTGRTF